MPGINGGAHTVPHAAWLRSSLVALRGAVAACVIGGQPRYMIYHERSMTADGVSG